MQRFKNILLIDSCNAEMNEALERAVELAESNQAQLTVVDVREASFEKSDLSKSSVPPSQPEEMTPKDRLEQIIAPIRDKGIHVDARVVTGIPFIEIIRQVLKYKYDLVIKTAAGATSTKAMLFGSTDLHLMRKCPCPVWMIKPIKHKRYARIMAAVNPETWDATKAGLNRVIMGLAMSLAMRENSELHLVLAWNPYLEALLPNNPAVSGSRESPGEPQIHTKLISELLAAYKFNGLKPQVHLVEGSAEDVILSVAREKQIDIIVMGTVGRVGIPGFFIGNTAEEVLRQVDCSVLTVKPSGFVTPVTE